MKRTDHILALTTTLLNSSESALEALLAQAGELYTLGEIRKPGAVSLGAFDQGIEYSFLEWIHQIFSHGGKTVRVHDRSSLQGSVVPKNAVNFPVEVATAFAGASDLLLELRFANKDTPARVYRMESFHSPSYELSPAGFASLLNAQHSPAALWARVAELMNESNRQNQRPLFEPGDAAGYLSTIEGNDVYAFLAADLLREMQIETAILGQSFEVPDHLQPMLIRYTPLFAASEQREYVYLYATREIAADELLTLVTAQPFAQHVWEKTNELLVEYPDPALLPIAVSEWPAQLIKMEAAMLQQYVSSVCRAICLLCEEQGLKPMIPAAITDAFGPNERDQLRASIRSKEDQFWSLRPASNPWEYYRFTGIDHPGFSATEPFPRSVCDSLYASRKQLTAILNQIEAFAASIQSSFQEPFGLAAFLLTESSSADPGDLSWKAMEARLQTGGAEPVFSPRAVQNFEASGWIAEQFGALGWSPAASLELISIGIADVFGGMGSWNDEYVETDTDTYHRLSSELFQALRRHLALLLSVSNRSA